MTNKQVVTSDGHVIEQGVTGDIFLAGEDLDALLERVVLNGSAVLIASNEAGCVTVHISYGVTERDDRAVGAFDTAEWGTGVSLDEAMRFALGNHFGSYEDFVSSGS